MKCEMWEIAVPCAWVFGCECEKGLQTLCNCSRCMEVDAFLNFHFDSVAKLAIFILFSTRHIWCDKTALSIRYGIAKEMPRVQPHAHTHTPTPIGPSTLHAYYYVGKWSQFVFSIILFCVCQAPPDSMVLCSRLNTRFFLNQIQIQCCASDRHYSSSARIDHVDTGISALCHMQSGG